MGMRNQMRKTLKSDLMSVTDQRLDCLTCRENFSQEEKLRFSSSYFEQICVMRTL